MGSKYKNARPKTLPSWILSSAVTLSVCLAAPAIASNLVKVKYMQPETALEQQMKALIVESGVTETFEQLVDELIPFDKQVRLYYGGEEGPLYDPQLHAMYVPYTFVAESKAYFAHHQGEELAEQGAIDTLLHTLLHEAGHALVFDNRIAILGKEEDAVDNLATMLMIEYIDGGATAAINAADMFDYESREGEEFYDYSEYIAEHSFDLQRYFSTLCLVYGSDPQRFNELLDEIDEADREERQEGCVETYETVSTNWHRYLETDQ